MAQNTLLRASLASGTVKKRIRMWGRPSVPNISAMPKLMAEIGSLMKPPGPMMARPALAAAEGSAPLLAAISERTRTPSANSASGLKPYLASTMKPMKVTPASSMQALMICTQVVAVMPPNST